MKQTFNRHLRPFTNLILIAVISFTLCALPAPIVFAEDRGHQEEEQLYYTALGDSIPNGYCADNTPGLISYPALIAEDLQTINQTKTELAQFTQNGLTTAKLNEIFLVQPEIQEALSKADIITVTIGANDLMNEFKKVSREILGSQTAFRTADEALLALQEGISANPLLLVDIVSAIAGWDYDSFEAQWLLAVETIHQLRKSDSQMAVTSIYNPVEHAGLPDTLNAVVKNLISKMNEIIYEHAEAYEYQVVDLLNSDIADHTQSDGLHPDQQGQELIRNGIETLLNMQLVQTLDAANEAQSEEAQLAAERIAAEKKAAELKAREEKHNRIIRSCLFTCGSILIIFAATAIIFRFKQKKKR